MKKIIIIGRISFFESDESYSLRIIDDKFMTSSPHTKKKFVLRKLLEYFGKDKKIKITVEEVNE